MTTATPEHTRPYGGAESSRPQWVPDNVIIDAVIAGRIHPSDLDALDKSWTVALLSARGHTVDQIAAWCGWSTRHVKRMRALELTVAMEGLARELEGNTYWH